MADYFVLTEQEAQEVVKNICDWVDSQCCGIWHLSTEATPRTAHFSGASATFGYFTVEINAKGVRVAKFRPDLATIDYEVSVHFAGYNTAERLIVAALRIKPLLLEAEAYTRHLEATN